MIWKLALTLAVGLLGGYVALRLRVPGGMMVGAMLLTAACGVIFNQAYMPAEARLAAQMVAGAFIAAGMDKNDLRRMRRIPLPIVILIGGMLLLNLVMGLLLHFLLGVDQVTAFYCAVPGGVSDIPIIAADAGAKSGTVALAQLARLVVGIGVFPSLVARFSKAEARAITVEEAEAIAPPPRTAGTVALTLGTAAVFGLIGYAARIPAGPMLFALLSCLVLKVVFNRAWLPVGIRRGAQVLSGCYIGSTITREELSNLRGILAPVLLVLLGYAAACFILGWALSRFAGMTRREGMLAAMPAGASDIALISSDLGVTSPDLIVLQLVRLLASIMLFPQVIGLVLRLMG